MYDATKKLARVYGISHRYSYNGIDALAVLLQELVQDKMVRQSRFAPAPASTCTLHVPPQVTLRSSGNATFTEATTPRHVHYRITTATGSGSSNR